MAIEHKHLPVVPPHDEEADPRQHRNEVLALICGICGVLYILALISYLPSDLPGWVPGNHESVETSGLKNYVGVLGTFVAAGSYFLFGAACYLIPVIILWFGSGVLLGFEVFRWRSLVALGVLSVAASCLVHFQPWYFEQWTDIYNLPGSKGGAIGFGIGHIVVGQVLGQIGGSVVAVITFALCLIYIAGYHPFQFTSFIRRKIREYYELQERLKAEAAAEPGVITLSCEVPKEREVVKTFYEVRPTPADLEESAAAVARRRADDMGYEADPVVYADDETEPVGLSPDSVPERETNGSSQNGNGQRVQPQPQPQKPTPMADPSLPRPKIIDTNRKARRPRPEQVLGVNSEAFQGYKLPTLDLLEETEEDPTPLTDQAELLETQATIIETLDSFGVQVSPGDITRGPTITRYEIYPSKGLRVRQITALADDLARATRAETINILAPIPGKATVGIEIANSRKVKVPLRDLLEDEIFAEGKAKVPMAIGKDVYGKTIVADLGAMPHLLVAGTTGSGKSVCINSIITSLLFKFTPTELRFIMVDPKTVEMKCYEKLPHLAMPVINLPEEVPAALQWCVNEMERRYALFASMGIRKLEDYNKRHARKSPANSAEADAQQMDLTGVNPASTTPDDSAADDDLPETLPYIVVIIDELADLMQSAPAEVEGGIVKLCQKARAAGIHLIVATQSPRVDVVTGLIKANIPARIAFQVPAANDSRVILDKSGAELLIGKGDLLFQPPDSPLVTRAQGAFLDDDEVPKIVDFCAAQAEPVFEVDLSETMSVGGSSGGSTKLSPADQETLNKCIEVIIEAQKASTSFLQRRLQLGYNRAARMMDLLEELGYVGPANGAKPREVLVGAPDDDEIEADMSMEDDE